MINETIGNRVPLNHFGHSFENKILCLKNEEIFCKMNNAIKITKEIKLTIYIKIFNTKENNKPIF